MRCSSWRASDEEALITHCWSLSRCGGAKVGDPNALIDDPSWRELLRYAVENDSYRGCPHPLMMEGTEDEASGGLDGAARL